MLASNLAVLISLESRCQFPGLCAVVFWKIWGVVYEVDGMHSQYSTTSRFISLAARKEAETRFDAFQNGHLKASLEKETAQGAPANYAKISKPVVERQSARARYRLASKIEPNLKLGPPPARLPTNMP